MRKRTRAKTGKNKAASPNPAVVRAAILEVVENQLRDGAPPETQRTFERLIATGIPAEEARRLIAVVVIHEVFGVLKRGEPYDEARYVAALQRLPELPGE